MLPADQEKCDREFIEGLYEKYYNFMLWAISKMAPNFDSTDDVINESFVSLLGKVTVLRKLEPPALSAYIYTTVTNHLRKCLKKESRRKKKEILNMEDLELPDPLLSVEIQTEMAEDLRILLNGLTESERILLLEKYYIGWSSKEIAGSLGMKNGAVKTALYRARKHALAILGLEGRT